LNQNHVVQIASELSLNPRQVLATAELLEGGATVPFIARYRKEVTGSLDEVAIMAIRTRLTQLAELDAQVALTEARTNVLQANYRNATAIARVRRAIGSADPFVLSATR